MQSVESEPSWRSNKLFWLFVVNFITLTALTWGRSGHPFVDGYQSLYVFKAIAEGQVLYKDLSYYFGPFAPYLLGLVFRIFGINLLCLHLTGLLIVLLVSWLLFVLVTYLSNSKAGWAVVFVFLNTFAFNNIGWSRLFNYIRPYNYSSIFAVVFILAALYFQARSYRNRSLRDAILWSLMTVGIALNRPDSAISYFLLSICFIVATSYRDRAFLIRVLRAYTIPFILLITVIYGYFAYRAGLNVLVAHNIFWIGHLPGVVNSHQANIMGLSYEQVLLSFKAFLLRAVAFLPVIFALVRNNQENRFIEMGCLLIVSMAVVAFHFLIEAKYIFADLQILLLVSFFALWIYCRKGHDFSFLVFVNIFALLSISRIFFNISIASYLFYMGIVPLVVIAVLLSRVLRFLPDGASKLIKCYLWLFLVSGLVRVGWVNTLNYWQLTRRVVTQYGTIYINPRGTEKAFANTISLISNMPTEIESLVVMPEGASINFFTGTNLPLYHPTLLPHVIRVYGESGLIAELEESSPDLIVFLHHYGAIWGEEDLFSVSYGVLISDWVRENYSPILQVGDEPFYFRNYGRGGAIVFCRNDLKCSL